MHQYWLPAAGPLFSAYKRESGELKDLGHNLHMRSCKKRLSQLIIQLKVHSINILGLGLC